MDAELRRTVFGLFVTLCCGLLVVYGDDIVESVMTLGSEYLADIMFWVEEEKEEQNAVDGEPPMHLLTIYVDLWPPHQFLLLRLYLSNEGRNETTWSTDGWLG